MNRRKLAIAFGIGILLCGLGCGIAFAQYSKFNYVGDRIISAEKYDLETIEESIDNESKLKICFFGDYCDININGDDTVPIDKIQFDVEYDPEAINLNIEKMERQKDEYEGLETQFYFGNNTDSNDIKEMFMFKDAMLKDLKDRKIGSYSVIYFKSITVRVNPVNYDRVEIM